MSRLQHVLAEQLAYWRGYREQCHPLPDDAPATAGVKRVLAKKAEGALSVCAAIAAALAEDAGKERAA